MTITTTRVDRIVALLTAFATVLAAVAVFFSARGGLQTAAAGARPTVVDALPVLNQPVSFALDTVVQNGRPLGLRPIRVSRKNGPVEITGWALPKDAPAPFAGMTAFLDGQRIVDADYGLPRPDVAAVYRNAGLQDVGYHVVIPRELLTSGRHVFRVKFVSPPGDALVASPPVTLEVRGR